MDYTDYVSSYGLDPSLLGGGDSGGGAASSQPIASTGKSDSTSLWGSLGGGLLTSTGSVLTASLNNQVAQANAKNQAKLAALRAQGSNSTMKIVIIAVVGLAVVGIIFAFLKRK
jgi:hypothetical protein